MAEAALKKRAEQLFKDRQIFETLWETAYDYIAPERAVFFRQQNRSPQEVGDEVFDSTAIDQAERLVNLIISGLTPPWQRWFRLIPGADLRDPQLREQIAPQLEDVEYRMLTMLSRSNFYQELQPVLLDRIVGGTGTLCVRPDMDRRRLRFKAPPLSEIAVEEDNAGEIVSLARRYKLSFRQIMRGYGQQVPQEWVNQHQHDEDNCKHQVYEWNSQDVLGDWLYVVFLSDGGHELVRRTDPQPYIFSTRWSKVPGSAYGRGPGLRALADVRALNKIKELALKNAAKSVAGIYTVTDDGVINPYTLSMEPGTFIPVAENDIQRPAIAPLPESGNFDVAMFQMDELRNSIKSIFMADQFQPLGRTPMSATEVMERTRVIAQDMGATIARLQFELLLPVLRATYYWMAQMGELPEELSIDGNVLDVDFVSQLAQAQWAQDEQNIVEFLSIATQFGDIDPKAGLVIDAHKALRKVGQIKGLPSEIMRTEQEIEELMQQAAEAQAGQEEQGGMAGDEAGLGPQ
jgi:hypothetical protein